MVKRVLVRVGLGERSHRVLELLIGPEVRRDHGGVARPGMTARQCPGAEFTPCRELVARHRVDDRTALLVLELADVDVPTSIADGPAEEDVARCLEATLARDDPLAVALVLAPAEKPLVHGRLGLFDLEEQRIVARATNEEGHEGSEPDTPDADDLEGEVDEPIPIEQDAPVFLQRLAISPQGRLASSWVMSGSLTSVGGRSVIRRWPSMRLVSFGNSWMAS